jgi:DNA mismatch repair protein MutS2
LTVTDLHTVRVIHGHGTGQLRRAIGEFLKTHPLVAHFEAASPEHGGSGVTVVELKQ